MAYRAVPEGELLSIKALGVTSSDAEELASAVYKYFTAHRNAISAGSAQHDLTLVSKVTKNVIDDALNTRKTSFELEIDDLRESIEKSEQSIEALKEPTREEGYSFSTILKAVVKYAIIGAVAGIFLACLAVFCKGIFSSRALSSFQLEVVSGASFLGSLRVPHSLSERLSNKAMNERYWKDEEQAAAYIVEQAKVCFPRDGKVLLLSTLSEKQAGAGMDKLAAALSGSGYAVLPILDALHNPKAVEAMQTCAAVVLVEMVGYSSIMAVRSCVARTEEAKKKVLGLITVDDYATVGAPPIVQVQLPQNRGLGIALNEGLKVIKNDLIARMDSDDYAMPKRCELQVKAFESNPDLDIIGCPVLEFVGTIKNVVGRRNVPLTNKEIYRFSKKRDPFNHPTVMYRKSAVEKAGGYSDYRKNQDTDLWIRMLSNNATCMNLADPVFYFRFDEETYYKRKSWINTKTLLEIRYKAWRSGFNSLGEFLMIAAAQMGMYILPVSFQKFLYHKILRR